MVRYINELAHDLRAGDYFDQRDRLLPHWVYVGKALYYVVKHHLLEMVCNRKGHIYEDVGSYAGPEGACEHLQCSRCGHSWSHRYF
jgi:hypothetical protein